MESAHRAAGVSVGEFAENLPDAMFLFDQEAGRIAYANQALERLSGLDAATLSAKPEAWLARVHDDDRAAALAGAAWLVHAPMTVRYRYEHPTSGLRLFEATLFPVARRPSLVAAVVRDVTELLLAEQRAARWESAREGLLRSLLVSELAQLVTHELGQPLAAMCSWTEGVRTRLRRFGEDSTERRVLLEALDKALEQGQRTGSIVSKLRRLVRSDEVVVSPVAPGLALDRALRELAKRGTGAISVAPPSGYHELPEVLVEPAHLEAAVISLLRVFEGRAAAGEIAADVTCSARVEARSLTLSFSLCGLSPASTRGPTGFEDLPLAVAASAVTAIGGSLQRRCGGDTESFALTLPLAAPAPSDERQP